MVTVCAATNTGPAFAAGSTVVFRAYAVDTKTKTFVSVKQVKYFYVAIPGQPNVKLKYNPTATGASKGLPWIGQWTVPSAYTPGLVPFKVLIKLVSKRTESPTSNARRRPIRTPRTNDGNFPRSRPFDNDLLRAAHRL